MSKQTIVIVGASLAGTRAAEALRDNGFSGHVVMIGEEPQLPYDRPPLSKQFLSGAWDAEQLELLSAEEFDDLEVDRRLGVRATGLDTATHRVFVDSGDPVHYDGLVVATGTRARLLADTDAGHDSVHTLRTLVDAVRLGAAIREPGRRVGIIGAGVLGAEIASTVVDLGGSATVLESASVPMGDVLGQVVGAALADLHRVAEVDLRCGARVDGVVRGDGQDTEIRLADGSALAFDDVVVAIGAVPNIEWLTGSGLRIDGGVVCAPTLFAGEEIVAAGDIVRIETAGVLGRRVEHWTTAAEQGELAAANLLAGAADAEVYRSVPYVWSDQFGIRLEIVGRPSPTAEVAVAEHDPDTRRSVFVYRDGGRVSAVVGINAQDEVLRIRRAAAATAELSEDILHQLPSPA